MFLPHPSVNFRIVVSAICFVVLMFKESGAAISSSISGPKFYTLIVRSYSLPVVLARRGVCAVVGVEVCVY